MGSARKNWLVAGDALRGMAALGVLVFHAVSWSVLSARGTIAIGDLGLPGRVLFNLDIGVFLFFVLSGYLIGRPFASAFVLQTPFPRAGRYLARRVLRLAPGAVAAALLAMAFFGAHWRDGTIHFWTLGAEACFYAALPVATAIALPLARALPGRGARAACWVGACAVVAVASVWFRARSQSGDFAHQQLFPSVAFAFAPGLALAALEPIVAPLLRAAPEQGRVLARGALALAVPAAVACFVVSREQFVAQSLLAVTACGLLLGAVLVRDWAGLPTWRALAARPVQWLGERSYSLYLFHFALVLMLTRHLGYVGPLGVRALVVTALVTPAALVLSWAGYALLERPFTRRRRAATAADSGGEELQGLTRA